MIALLASAALAQEPPRLEVLAGFSGTAEQGYRFVTVQPALLRAIDASLVLRTTASHLTYDYVDGLGRHSVDSPGLSVGPAFVYASRDLSLGMGIGLGARRSVNELAGVPEVQVKPDVTLGGDLFWRPGQRAQVSTSFAFSAAEPYLLGRVGASHPVLPFGRSDAPVSVWLGLSAGASGALRSNDTGAWDAGRFYDVGPVIEVPIRDLRATVSARVGPWYQQDREGGPLVQQGTSTGMSVYWAY